MRRFSDYSLLFLKGMGMGAADVVPGVSGGTIAFITGIYEELISSIKSVNIEALKLLVRFRFSALWRSVNGNFLLAVFAGILVSIFSLARLLEFLMENHPVLIWAFFFGLILASAIVVTRKIKTWKPAQIAGLLAGTVIMFFVTRFTPAQTSDAYWYVFLAGAIAICAMILPGISGAFILLILGKYRFILEAVGDFNIPVLLVFGLGIITGLLSFANLLSWLFRKFHDLTIAVLAGFIIGSLNKIWPWKETISSIINTHGETVPLVQRNVLPHLYNDITGQDPFILQSLLLMAMAFIMVIILDRLGRKK
jgi:putative membrane protein